MTTELQRELSGAVFVFYDDAGDAFWAWHRGQYVNAYDHDGVCVDCFTIESEVTWEVLGDLKETLQARKEQNEE